MRAEGDERYMRIVHVLVVAWVVLVAGLARADPAAPGIERVAAPFRSPVPVGDGRVTVVRIDPRTTPLRLLTAQANDLTASASLPLLRIPRGMRRRAAWHPRPPRPPDSVRSSPPPS